MCTGSSVRRSRATASRFCTRCITPPSVCARLWHCIGTKRSFGKCWRPQTGPNCTRCHPHAPYGRACRDPFSAVAGQRSRASLGYRGGSDTGRSGRGVAGSTAQRVWAQRWIVFLRALRARHRPGEAVVVLVIDQVPPGAPGLAAGGTGSRPRLADVCDRHGG